MTDITGSTPAREAYRGLVRRQSVEVLDPETLRLEKEQKAAKVRSGQQLYAKIKKSSKYFHQNDMAERNPQWGGFPFPVRVAPVFGDYCVQGGPGGQYRLADVNLYVLCDDGRELKIS